MNITPELKQWLIENCDLSKDATDDDCRKAAGDALASGTLSAEKFAKLSKPRKVEEANEFAKQLETIGKNLEKLVEAKEQKPEPKPEKKEESEAKDAEPEVKAKPSEMAKMIVNLGGTPIEPDIDVRVKEAAEQYDSTKSVMVYPSHNKSGRSHPLAGRPVMDFDEGGRVINHASQRDKAVIGAYCKFMAEQARLRGSRKFAFQNLPQHDKELLLHAMDNYEWSGATDGRDTADIINRKLFKMEKQALIDDAVSGGLEAAPIVFDVDVIETPLLHGELFPLVNQVPLDRGRRVEGVATGTVTGAWGGVDDTAIALFNTAAYVTAFDTTIFRWEGSIRIGLDFLSDTPIDFGQHVTQQYGERLLEDLDDVVATGNGTTQPEGVMNATGVTTVAWGGATTLGNYESLRFGVAKAEHRANVATSAVFCGTETSYQRARAIPVGAADARRLGGMDYSSYNWMERPYKINESLANTQIFYAILARYRMYRRRGLTMRSSTEGDTLIRRNEMLLVGMARYGGQLERGATAAVTTTAPA
jgi:HK97 family phage major capsid protein